MRTLILSVVISIGTLIFPGSCWPQGAQLVAGEATRQPTPKATATHESYIPKFKQLQVIAAGDDWAVVHRAGKKWTLNHNEIMGPAHAFIVRIENGKLVLYDRFKQIARAKVTLPREDETSAAAAVMIRDSSSNNAPSAPPRPPDKAMVMAVGREPGAAGQPEDNIFPDVRPPQVTLYETPVGSAIRFLLRDQPRLSIAISAEDAEEIVDSFQVNGNLRIIMNALSEKTGMFIVREGNNVVVGRSRLYMIVTNDGLDASQYIDPLRQLGARNISLLNAPRGVRFEMDMAAWKRMVEWIAKGEGS